MTSPSYFHTNSLYGRTTDSFASLSALEASKDMEEKKGFSADHLIYQNPFGKSFDEGGSYVVTMAYLLSWDGPVFEEKDPFDGTSEGKLEADLHVQEIRQIEPNDYDAIKSLRIEAVQKLKLFRPVSIGQASRISGVSPSWISTAFCRIILPPSGISFTKCTVAPVTLTP